MIDKPVHYIRKYIMSLIQFSFLANDSEGLSTSPCWLEISLLLKKRPRSRTSSGCFNFMCWLREPSALIGNEMVYVPVLLLTIFYWAFEMAFDFLRRSSASLLTIICVITMAWYLLTPLQFNQKREETSSRFNLARRSFFSVNNSLS